MYSFPARRPVNGIVRIATPAVGAFTLLVGGEVFGVLIAVHQNEAGSGWLALRIDGSRAQFSDGQSRAALRWLRRGR